MGVSFKISKVGSRYRPKVPPLAAAPPDPVTADNGDHEGGEVAKEGNNGDREDNFRGLNHGVADHSVSSSTCEESQASFYLNLYPNGFSVGKPTEGMVLRLLEDAPEALLPYDRASMTLFSAIEYGWLPGDIFDDIPCKYLNGTVMCEVWDYRTCLSKLGNNDSPGDKFPKVQKVCLRMGMENVVKDLALIIDDSWSYNDILEVESRITKALQPELFLSPYPSLDRFCGLPYRKQLDLGICRGGLTRKQNDVPEINLQSADTSHVRDISRNGCFDSLKPQRHVLGGTFRADQSAIPISMPNVQQNDFASRVSEHSFPVSSKMNYNSAFHCSSTAHNEATVTSNSLSAPGQNTKDSSSGIENFIFLPEKRDRCELQFAHEPFSKRSKQDTVSNYCQHALSQRDSLIERELQNNIIPSQKQIGIQTMLQPRIGDIVSYLQSQTNRTIVDRVRKPEAQRPPLAYQGDPQYSVTEALHETKILPDAEAEAVMDKEGHALDIGSDKYCLEQTLPFKSSLLPQMHCSSTGPSIEKYANKESTFRKRKATQGPLVSSRDTVKSPVPKSGENCWTSTRAPYNTSTDVRDLGCPIDKAAPAPPVSVVSGIIHSLARQNQMSRNTKKAPKFRGKVEPLSKDCSGPQVTVSDSNVLLYSNNSSMGTALVQPLPGCNADHLILERFSKVVRVAARHGLGNKKSTPDQYLTSKSMVHFPLAPMLLLPEDSEECVTLTNKMCMSKFLIGGNRNICKTRKMTFVRVRYLHGVNGGQFAVFDSGKLVLFESENSEEHEIGAEVIYGEEDSIPLPPLPSPHHADLFAAQFISLMEREGYELKFDRTQPAYTSFTDVSSRNSDHIGFTGDAKLTCAVPISVQSLKQVGSFGSKISMLNPPHLFSSQCVPTPTRHAAACFNLNRPKQLEPVACLNSMQQPYTHNQNSMLSGQNNVMGYSTMRLGGRLPNNCRSTHPLQLQQYVQQQQQHEKNFLSKMHSLGATGHGIGMGTRMSGLNVSQIGHNLRQVSGFGNSGVQFTNGENSQVQATSREKPRQTSIQSTGITDGMPVKTLAKGIVRVRRDGSLLDRAQASRCIGEFPDSDNICTGPKHIEVHGSQHMWTPKTDT